jgi:hypothetical protein
MKYVALLLAIAVAVPTAEALPLPAPDRLQRLDGELKSAYRVRIAPPQGTLILGDARATDSGVEYGELVHSARPDTLRSPGSIPWAEIERIQAGGQEGSRWFTKRNGTVVGAGVGLVAMFSTGWGWHLPIWAAVGFLTCAAVQWHAGRWHTVYP